jgi:hypothetical protein
MRTVQNYSGSTTTRGDLLTPNKGDCVFDCYTLDERQAMPIGQAGSEFPFDNKYPCISPFKQFGKHVE